MASAAIDPEVALAAEVVEFRDDPLGFVLCAYPWGEPGPLKDHSGPDIWQEAFLRDLGAEVKAKAFDGHNAVSPIRRAVSSGHGIGKSVMVAWLVDWIMSTRPHCQGTITANTFTQLETKTWAAIQRWTKLCITSHWFSVTSNRMYQVDHKDSWFCAPQSSKEDNSEAFAGQHAADSTSFYIFDEDSAIPDKIHEVAEGGLTDGEPMIFCYGNPTRNSGHFYDACFGRMRSRWNPTVVDSRTSRFTNKEQIKEWAEDYGEDSDFFRVRVLGLPPSASDAQFIDQNRVLQAQRRQIVVLPDEPLVAGADLAWGGGDDNVIRFRCGLDGRSIPPIRIKGEFTRDPAVLTNRLADVLSQSHNGKMVSMLFLDSAGIAGPIAQRLRTMGHKNVQEVNFGSDSPDPKCRYYRDFMWYKMKEWLLTGAIDSHHELEADLTGPGIRPDNRQRVWLESKETMKKRGVDSPDDADALCHLPSTLVSTPSGPRTLGSIRVGDLVETPFGPSEVMFKRSRMVDSLTTVTLSDGKSVTSSDNHEFFTFSRGPVRADAIILTDELDIDSSWRRLAWRIVSLPFMVAGSIGFKAQAHTFRAGLRQTRSGYFIAGCGRMLTDLFRKVWKCITWTGIGGTTSLVTSNSFQEEAINANTCFPNYLSQEYWNRTGFTWKQHASRLRSGTDQKLDVNGTENMGSGLGSTESQLRKLVSIVGAHTVLSSLAGQADQKHDSAPRRAVSLKPRKAIGTFLQRVVTVARHTWLTAIGLRPIVPVSVQTDTVLPTEVMNLTLRDHNAYYANGILVFNCLTFAAEVKPKVAKRGVPMDASWSWS